MYVCMIFELSFLLSPFPYYLNVKYLRDSNSSMFKRLQVKGWSIPVWDCFCRHTRIDRQLNYNTTKCTPPTTPAMQYRYSIQPRPAPSLTSPTNQRPRSGQLTDHQPMGERDRLAGKFKYPAAQSASPAEFEAENNWNLNSCWAGWVIG